MEHKVRTSGSNPRESTQQIHRFLLRQPAAVYAAFLGVAFGAIVLSVTFAIGAVEVGVPRWVWSIDLLVVVAFVIDHVRFAVSRRRAPTGPMLGAALAIGGVLIALTLFVCW